MTRKNKVDDLLTRFERKPINQKKHGFKSIETMIASVLEKHYDSI